MRKALTFLAIAAMIFTPVAPAAPALEPVVAAAESCAMACCREEAPAADDCGSSCRCPVSCVLPVAPTAAVVPAVSAILVLSSRLGRASIPQDESGTVRALRPEVPPPRA